MNYIAYSINNMYLAGIHAGIQSTHSHDELTIRHLNGTLSDSQSEIFLEWLRYHKTMIIKNGGDSEQLYKTLGLCLSQSKYPFAWFREPGLDKVLTNITIVLPVLSIDGELSFRDMPKEDAGLIDLVTSLPNAR